MAEKEENIVKLKVKDRKLLYYLSKNARESYTQIAKKVGLSKNAVSYKVESMKKQGVIKNFSSVINIGAIGADTFTIFMKFNKDIYEDKSIIDYFKEHESADWVVTLSGGWDIFAEFVFKDIRHMTEIIRKIITKFKEELSLYEVIFSNQIIKVEHLVPDFYKDLKLVEIEKSERKFENFKLDIVDRKLLNLLALDSSLNFIALSDKLNLTLDVVRYRLKKLVDSGIIIKFFPTIALDKLGYQEYLCKIKLRNFSNLEVDKIKLFLKNNPNIAYSFFDIASATFIFTCAFKISSQIDSLLRGLRANFLDIIESQNYLLIKEQVLFNLFPRGLINL
jgi:Lrp/AsnC family leucine-responsive transcriptional regulator